MSHTDHTGRDYPDEETRKRWQLEAFRSTLSLSSNLEANASHMYSALSHQQGHHHHHPAAASGPDMFAYQQGPPYPVDPFYADALQHHQWACNTMGLTIPPIPGAAYTDMSGGGYAPPPTQTVVMRKRRRGSSSVDYTEPSSETDEQTSSLSTAAAPKTRSGKQSKKKSSSASKRTGKRFAWPEDLHRDFVSAIFATGLKHATPGQLADIMSMKTQAVSTDAVKSFLLKYRTRQEESRNDFLSSFEAGQAADKAAGDETGSTKGASNMPAPMTMAKEQHGLLSLPKLTEDEANSHLGASLGYLMGLLITLEQQLVAQRAAAQLNSFRSAHAAAAAGRSVGATMAQMHHVREQVRQRSGDDTAKTVTDSTTATTIADTEDHDAATATAAAIAQSESEQARQQDEEDTHSNVTAGTAPESPGNNLRAKLMVQRHGSIDIGSLDGLEENDDEENIFSFLSSI